MRVSGFIVVAGLAQALVGSGLAAQELRVLAGGAGLAAPLDRIVAAFGTSTGAKVVVKHTSGGTVGEELGKAADVDVGVLPTEYVARLVAAKKLVESSRLDLANARVAFAVKKGALKPNASTLELFQATLTEARSIVYPDPKGGSSLSLMFSKTVETWAPSWGIVDELRAKTKLASTVAGVNAALKSGEAQLGVLLTTQIAGDPDIELASLMPAELRLSNLYVAYVMVDSKQPELAAKFLAFLATPAAKEIVRAAGFEAPR